MKYLRQFCLIMFVTCIGEIMHYFIPLPIPASIYGLCLMLILLMSGALKADKVKETSDFLIEIMPLMFIPASVGIIVSWDKLRQILLPVIIITAISTVLVMVVSGRVTQFLIGREKKK